MSDSTKVFTPISPLPKYFSSNPRAGLSEHEQALYSQVLDHFAAFGYRIPGVEEKPELTEDEKFWLSRECILR